MTFGDRARAAAGFAAAMFGWTPDTFWAATPADLCNALGALLPPDPGIGELKRMMDDDERRA